MPQVRCRPTVVRTPFLIAVFALAGLLLAVAPASAAPPAPCSEVGASSAYPPVGATPDVSVWLPYDDANRPPLPRCSDWPVSDDATVVATVGRFIEPGGMPAIVERIASPSRFTTIRYWSVTRQEWRPMIAKAHALAHADADAWSEDVAPDSIVTGSTLFYLQRENGPTGEVIYRLDVLARSDDRLVIDLRNMTAVRLMLLPLFDAGDQRAIYVIEREAGDNWTYYQLARTPPLGPGMDLKASYINRAVAVFRYTAGLATDAAPPAAPKR